MLLRLSSAGVRIKRASSVLEPQRVQAVLEGMEPSERAQALEGLELLARAAQGYMATRVRQKNRES